MTAVTGADDLPRAAPLRCPRCRTSDLVELRGARQAYCDACRGVLAERDALPEALGVASTHPLLVDARQRATITSAPCPHCAVPLERLRLDPEGTTAIDECPRCGAAFLGGADRSALRDRVATLAAAARAPRRGPRPPDFELPFHGPRIAALSLPVAFAVSAALVATDLRALPELVVNMPFHELGHAAVAWLTGHMAIPLPFVTITFHERQSPAIIGLVFAVLVALVTAGVRSQRRYLTVVGVVGLVIQLLFTGPLARRFSGVWMSGSGVAGEYVWSTLAIVSFHYRLPERARWEIWRWLALAAGAFGLAAVTQRWWGEVPDLAAGCTTRVGVHASSDMHVLMDDYGLPASTLLSTYHALGVACWGVVVAHYAAFLGKALRVGRPRPA
jgi:Zn-finger nucleic acid-binding protein